MGRVTKIYNRVENTRDIVLSKEQQEILDLLTGEDMLTPKQVAKRRNTGLSAVYKTIEKLKKKGLVRVVEKSTITIGGNIKHSPNGVKLFRLHRCNFVIELIKSSELYERILKQRTRDEYDNNTLNLESDKIVVYLKKDFWGDTVNECFEGYNNYLDLLITRLENNYKIVLRSKFKCNLKEFNGELAKVGDPHAREINESNEKLRVYDSDGTLRLLVDNSFKYDELETVSKYYKDDMKSLEAKWMDLIKTDLKLSEVKEHLAALQKSGTSSNTRMDRMERLLEQVLDIQNTNAVTVMGLSKTLEDRYKKWKE